MPTLNKMLLLKLLVTFLLIGGGLFAAHEFQSGRALDALRRQSEKAAAEGKMDRAVSYMRQYLELRPDDHDAAVRCGDLVVERDPSIQGLSSAYFLYDKVVRESPDRDDVRRKLADLSVRMGRYADGMSHAQALLEKHPEDSLLWEQLAACQAGLNKPDDARISYEKALTLAPSHIATYDRLAQLLSKQIGLPGEAELIIKRMIEENPRQPEAYLSRARYYRAANKLGDAQKDAEKLLALSPNNADGQLMLAELLQMKGETEKARSLLTDGSTAHPEDARFCLNRAWIEMDLGNFTLATAFLEEGTQRFPNDLELLTTLGNLYAEEVATDRVQAIIAKLEAHRAPPTDMAFIRGRLAMQQGKWTEAMQLLEPLKADTVNVAGMSVRLNLLLSICHDHLGDRDAQLQDLKRVLEIDATQQAARAQLAMIATNDGRFGDAVKEYNIICQSPYASLATRVTLGEFLIARAKTISDGEAWAGVIEYARQLAKRYPQSNMPVLLLADAMSAAHQPEEAIKMLREQCGKNSTDARVWARLAEVTAQVEGIHSGFGILDEALSLVGDSVDLRLTKARLWAIDWQPGGEERVRSLAEGVRVFPEAEQVRLFAGLADICECLHDWQGLKTMQLHISDLMPRDVGIRRALLESALAEGDESLASRMIKELKAMEGVASVTVAVAEAGEALRKLKGVEITEPLRELVKQLLQQNPDRADVQLLAGRVAEREAATERAQKHYDRALELDGSNLRTYETRLGFLMRSGQDEAARKMAAILAVDPRLSNDRFRALIEVATEGIPVSRLEGFFTWFMPIADEQPIGRFWAIRIAEKRGIKGAAKKFAPAAPKANAKSVDEWVARVQLALADGIAQAKAVLGMARGALPESSYRIVCAELGPDWHPWFDGHGDQRADMQAELMVMRVRNRTDDAKKLLELFAADAKTSPEDAAWANKNLSMIAAVRGNADAKMQAIQDLLKQTTAPKTIPQMRSRVDALAVATSQPARQDRDELLAEAVTLMKQVVASPESTLNDWAQLGRCCWLSNDHKGTQEVLRHLMQADSGNLVRTAAYVDELTSTEGAKTSTPELESLLVKLEISPDPRAVLVAAKVYMLADQPAKSLEVFDRFVRGAAGGQESAVRTRQAVESLDNLTRFAISRKLTGARSLRSALLEKYLRVLPGNADVAVRMASFLAFDNAPGEALDLLTRAGGTVQAKGKILAGLAALRCSSSEAKQYDLVHGWLDEAIHADPRDVQLHLLEADWHLLRNDYPGAEAAYRGALKVDPRSVVALNNLAWIMAPRRESADESLGLVEQAIEIAGKTGDLLETRARIKITRGEYEQGLEDLNTAIGQSPNSLRYFLRALVLLKEEKEADALRDFKEARTRGLDTKMIHPTDLEVYKVLSAKVGS